MKYKYIYSNAYKIICVVIIAIIIYVIGSFVFNNDVKEGFVWSRDLISRFTKYQDSVNLNDNQYNLAILQQQASPEEVEQLLKNGHWSWSDDIKNLYLKGVWQNPIIKFYPEHALIYAMRLYNEQSAKQLLSWNTKEGEFLLYGGTNTNDKNKNIIKCSDDANPVLQKTTYPPLEKIEGKWGLYQEKGESFPSSKYSNNTWIGTKVDIANENIPNEMPGFTFINKPCNPCSVLNETPDYSCAFKLNVDGDNETSDIWKKLWGLF